MARECAWLGDLRPPVVADRPSRGELVDAGVGGVISGVAGPVVCCCSAWLAACASLGDDVRTGDCQTGVIGE